MYLKHFFFQFFFLSLSFLPIFCLPACLSESFLSLTDHCIRVVAWPPYPTPPVCAKRKTTGEDLGVERGLPRAVLCQVVPLQHPAQRREQRGHRQGRSCRSFLGGPRVRPTDNSL